MKNTVVHGWSETARVLGLQEDLYVNPLHRPLAQPVRAVLLGAGHRGSSSADFAANTPADLQLVAVADPNPRRRLRTARAHGIPDERCFVTWDAAMAQPDLKQLADAVIIAMPDHLHTVPCLQALDQGLDVLLEKPIAPTEA
ncbi:MAG: Gfo/Idh/MocA family oxidoreductase, partial [Rubrivivax sp.]|nr:Gfo/Idh/MocA family oxidoreductase [Rubrivivax sp.]